jgi:hypothetical protein
MNLNHPSPPDIPRPRSAEGLCVYAKKRGMEVGVEAAEAFVVLRDNWS